MAIRCHVILPVRSVFGTSRPRILSGLIGCPIRRSAGWHNGAVTGSDDDASSPTCSAARYASRAMAELWSPEHKVVLERRLWLAVLEAQADAGLDVPAGAVDAYRAAVDKVDLASIEARERITKHDVKARIEEFSRPRRPRAHPRRHDVA